MAAYDDDDLRIAGVDQLEGGQLLAGDSQLIIRNEAAGTDDAEGELRFVNRLKPTERGVVRIGQNHPAAAGAKPNQTLVERENVRRLNGKDAKSRCCDFHIATRTFPEADFPLETISRVPMFSMAPIASAQRGGGEQ